MEWFTQYHLAGIVILVTLAVILSIALYSRSRAARIDAKNIPTEISTPSQMKALLASYENLLPPGPGASELKERLKTLGEKIISSLQPEESILANPQYLEFSAEVKALDILLQQIQSSEERFPELYEFAEEQVQLVESKIPLIAETLKTNDRD